MKIPPAYHISLEILELISKIDSYRLFFLSRNIADKIKNNIQRISLLKSSLYSARIEGNPLTLEEIETSTNEKKKTEIYNILKAVKHIEKEVRPNSTIRKELLLDLHSIVMTGLSGNSGKWRKEMSAIFDQIGMVIYTTPPPEKIKSLTDELFRYISSKAEKFPLITAFISHLIFEKIHPFIDGNGRVGRLLVYAISRSQNYDFGLFIPFEEHLDNNKSDYYHFLEVGFKETNEYLKFMLKAYLAQIEKIKEQIEKEEKKEFILPPRQEEIYNIINDHRIVSFDLIKRRFTKVPSRTLRYDLKKLLDQNLISKIGKTKGSYYSVANGIEKL